MPELSRPAAFDWEAEIADSERDALLETVVKAVRRWRLELPVTLFLEIHAPLSHLAGQGLVVFSPFSPRCFPAEFTTSKSASNFWRSPKICVC